MVREVPVLPVVIPLGVVVFGVLLWRLHARRLFSLPRAAVAAALAVYAGGIVGNTVFPIFLGATAGDGPWLPPVALIPFADYEFADAAVNMLVFLPLGMMLPLLLARPTWWRVLASATAVSLGIEATQFITHELFAGGHISDVSDLISNVAGAAVGYGIFRLLARVPILARLIDHFRWAHPGAAGP